MRTEWADTYIEMLNKKPLTAYQMNYAKKTSAEHIIINDKDGNGVCQKCDNPIFLPKTKHKSEVICPNCKEQMTAIHSWRVGKNTRTINWTCFFKALDKDTLALRYVESTTYKDSEILTVERARLIVSSKRANEGYYTYNANTDEWENNKIPYFCVPNMCFNNAHFCMYAEPYTRTMFAEMEKLDCFKYYSIREHYEESRIPSQMIYWVKFAGLNEKLEKANLGHLICSIERYCYQDKLPYSVNLKKTDLVGMLKLDKARYKMLKNIKSMYGVATLQKCKGLNEEDTVFACNHSYEEMERLTIAAEKVGVTNHKLIAYVEKQGCAVYEYTCYLKDLESLNYDLKDKSYSMPKNFSKEYGRIEAEKVGKKYSEQTAKINEISQALRNMPNLAEFMNGSNGLMVYVPESANDLIAEGKALHNCIGTYVNRIASKSTLVFFIRQIDNPTAPFVAMEYDGSIVQVRYDHNKAVEKDSNIYDFAERFATALTKAKVLTA